MTRRRLRGDGLGSVPVVLPRVVVRPDGAGTVAVTLDGQAVSEGPIPRVQLGEALSQIVEQLGTAVRVEIHEPDGMVHADILTPPAGQRDESGRATEQPDGRDRRRTSEVVAGGRHAGRPAHAAAPVVVAAAHAGERVSKRPDPKPAPDWYVPSPAVRATSPPSRHQGLA